MSTLFAERLTDLGDCASGRHTWHTTLTVGQSICTACGIAGYCLYCTQGDIPPGSPLRLCRLHRHGPARLSDSTRPLSAFTRKEVRV